MQQPGATLHERIVMAVLASLACALPLLVVLAHRGIAPVILVMGLAVATRAEPWRVGIPYFLRRPDFSNPLVRTALFFGAFALWASITGIWAPRADAPRLGINILLPVIAGGAVIWEIARRPPEFLRRLGFVFAVSIAVAITLIGFEAATDGLVRSLTPPTDESLGRFRDMNSLGRGATIIAITIVPSISLLYLLTRNRILVALLATTAVVAALKFEIFANVVGMLLAAFVFAAAIAAPKSSWKGLGAVVIAALVLAPLAVFIPVDVIVAELSGRFPVSWLQRLAIWQGAADGALDCLPFGCGADYARAIHADAAKIVLPGSPVPLSRMPVHPHNLFLQIWLEFGLPGVALFGAAIVSGIQAVLKSPLGKIERAAVAATAAGVFVSAFVELSIWQVWRIAAPLLAGILIVLAYKLRADEHAK